MPHAASSTPTTRGAVCVAAPLPPPWAGVEVVTQMAVNGLQGAGWQVRHVNLAKQANSAKGALTLQNLCGTVAQCRRFWMAVAECDVAYVTLAQNLTGFARDACLIWLATLRGRPVIAHFHGGDFAAFIDRLPRWAHAVVARTLRRVKSLLVLGPVVEEQFRPFRCDCTVLPNAVPDVWTHAVGNFPRKPVSGTLNVLFVGYVSQAKGAVDLAKAVACMRSEHPEVELNVVLAGEAIDRERNIIHIAHAHGGPDRVREIIAGAHLADVIECPGVISGDQKIAAYQNADVFVLPSYSEGQPMAILEAMAAGLPVLTTKVGAIPSLFTGSPPGAILVDPGDIAAICGGLEWYARHPQETRAFGVRNQEWIRQHASEHVFATSLDRLLCAAIQ